MAVVVTFKSKLAASSDISGENTTETTELRNGFQFGNRCPAHFRLAYVIKFLFRKHAYV